MGVNADSFICGRRPGSLLLQRFLNPIGEGLTLAKGFHGPLVQGQRAKVSVQTRGWISAKLRGAWRFYERGEVMREFLQLSRPGHQLRQ